MDCVRCPASTRGSWHEDGFLSGDGTGGSHVQDITDRFRRSPVRISRAIIEIEERLRDDESLKVIPNRLEKDLNKDAKRRYFITIA
jgi:hypothetical protein